MNTRSNMSATTVPKNRIGATNNHDGDSGDSAAICSHSARAGEDIRKGCPRRPRRPHRSCFRHCRKRGRDGFNRHQMDAVLNLSLGKLPGHLLLPESTSVLNNLLAGIALSRPTMMSACKRMRYTAN